MLGVGDHGQVHDGPVVDGEAQELRPGLLLDRAVRLAHVVEVAVGPRAALALGEDLGRDVAPLEVVPETLQLGEARLELAEAPALGVADFLGLAQPLVSDLEPLGAVRLELRELQLALRVGALALELRDELLELLAAGAPQGLEPEVHQRVEAALGAPEQDLELLELLLQARVGVLLLLQLVAQVVQLVIEALELLLELGAVPEELEQPLLLGRVGLADGGQLQLRPLVGEHHGHAGRSGGGNREAVAAADAVLEPLVEQHVAGPARAAAWRDLRDEPAQARVRRGRAGAAGLGEPRVVVHADLEPGLARDGGAVAEQIAHLQRRRVAALLDDRELERGLARDLGAQRTLQPPEVGHEPPEADEVALVERHEAHERSRPRAPGDRAEVVRQHGFDYITGVSGQFPRESCDWSRIRHGLTRLGIASRSRTRLAISSIDVSVVSRYGRPWRSNSCSAARTSNAHCCAEA